MPRALSIGRFDDATPPSRCPGRDAPARACGSDGAAAGASAASKPADRLCADMSPPATSGAISERLDEERAPGQATGAQGATTGRRRLCGMRRKGGVPWDAANAAIGIGEASTNRALAPLSSARTSTLVATDIIDGWLGRAAGGPRACPSGERPDCCPLQPQSVPGGTEPRGRDAASIRCGRPHPQSCVGSSR